MYTMERMEACMEEEKQKLEEIGMLIDIDSAKRFFYQLRFPQPIIGLNLPSNFKNQSLRSLLSVGYGSERDSSNESDGSSHGSSNDEESDESNAEEWSQVFTKDGHFRVDRILSLLPEAPQPTKWQLNSFLQNLIFARLALAHYNKEHKDAPYELVMPVMSGAFHTPGHNYYVHVNFFAKKLGSTPTESWPELFFAESVACYKGDKDPVLRCCILKPNLDVYSKDLVKHYPSALIFHPEDVACSCNIPSNCDTQTDDDSS